MGVVNKVYLINNGTDFGVGNVGMVNSRGYLGLICDNSWTIKEVIKIIKIYIFWFTLLNYMYVGRRHLQTTWVQSRST